MISISLQGLLTEAVAKAQGEKLSSEITKLGTLRAGNSGIMIGDTPAGSCPRVAHLRSIGISTEMPTEDKLIT